MSHPPAQGRLLTARDVAEWMGYAGKGLPEDGADRVRRNPRLRAVATRVSPRSIRWHASDLAQLLGGPTRQPLLDVPAMMEYLGIRSPATIRKQWSGLAVWSEPLLWRIEDVEATITRSNGRGST